MSRPLSTAAALAAVLLTGLALTVVASPAHARAQMMSFGVTGSVTLLDFSGATESVPSDHTDVGQASVQCSATARGRRAVFAGARAWAPDETPGLHNDWAYVRVAAGAVDDQGRTRTGEVSPYYATYDDDPAVLPAVSVLLPRDGDTYTPVLVVQFYDSTYQLVGSTMLGAQTGAWRVSLPAAALGSYWYVGTDDLVRCP
jgi:hypothetical protein